MSITNIINMKTIKTIIFLIVSIYIVVNMNKHFFDIYEHILTNTKEILTNYTQYIYLFVPLVFWFASKAKEFKYTDGYFELYIKKMLESVTDHKNYYSKTHFFHGALSNIAIYIFSLLAVASGAGLGDEGVIIYSSVCLMLYFYFKIKDVVGLHHIYTELLIYIGYAIGFTVIFGSAITTFFYILENMLAYKDANFFSNFGVILCAIPFINYLVNEEEHPIKHTLVEILHQANLQNPDFLASETGYKIETTLTFPRNWGLGTSSTLINNIAQWANVNAFTLLNNSFGGNERVASISASNPNAAGNNGGQINFLVSAFIFRVTQVKNIVLQALSDIQFFLFIELSKY